MLKNNIFPENKRNSILFLFIIFCIFPFIYIAQYNLPLSDEFACMYYRTSHSFLEYQNILSSSWSGRYIANFLEIIYPLKPYYPFYQLLPIILIILFYSLILLISKKIVSQYFIFTSFILFILILNYIPSIGDFLYYTPAIIIYTVTFLSVLILIYIWLLEINIQYKILAFILNNILLLGTTELYIPVVLFFSSVLLINSIVKKRFILFYLTNQLIVLIIISYLFTQKGNMSRYNTQKVELDLYSCVYHYIYSIFYWTKKFLILIPFLYLLFYSVRKDRNIINLSKKISWMFIFFAAIGYFAFFSPLFLIDLTRYVRTANAFFFYFFILTSIIFIKIIPISSFKIKNAKVFLITGLFFLFVIKGNVKNTYLDLYRDKTKNMSSGLKTRYTVLEKNRNSKLLILDRIPKTNYILEIQDVNDTNDTSLVVVMYKMYYNIDSLVIK